MPGIDHPITLCVRCWLVPHSLFHTAFQLSSMWASECVRIYGSHFIHLLMGAICQPTNPESDAQQQLLQRLPDCRMGKSSASSSTHNICNWLNCRIVCHSRACSYLNRGICSLYFFVWSLLRSVFIIIWLQFVFAGWKRGGDDVERVWEVGLHSWNLACLAHLHTSPAISPMPDSTN